MHPQALDCQSIVLRALIRATHIDRAKGRVLAAAFMLREGEEGLSVSYDCTAQECAEGFNKCFGVASLHVGRVRNLGLDVIPDTPHHANIIGLPHQQDDPTEAERLASQLRKQARLVPLA